MVGLVQQQRRRSLVEQRCTTGSAVSDRIAPCIIGNVASDLGLCTANGESTKRPGWS